MHMWVIYVGRHLSRTLENLHVSAGDRTGDLSFLRRALYHVAIKAGLYRKAVLKVYDIPNQYPVTLAYTVSFVIRVRGTREAHELEHYRNKPVNARGVAFYERVCSLEHKLFLKWASPKIRSINSIKMNGYFHKKQLYFFIFCFCLVTLGANSFR